MFELNKRYNFITYAPGVLGGNYTNVKVLSILNYSVAVKYNDVATMHNQVYPLLPSNTPIDYRDLTYVLLELENGDTVVFATAWIDSSSIQLSSSVDIFITVKAVSMQDVTRIQEALTLLGYTGLDIKTQESQIV